MWKSYIYLVQKELLTYSKPNLKINTHKLSPKYIFYIFPSELLSFVEIANYIPYSDLTVFSSNVDTARDY